MGHSRNDGTIGSITEKNHPGHIFSHRVVCACDLISISK